MRICLLASVLLLGSAAAMFGQVPHMTAVEPNAGAVGSVLRIKGNFLDKTRVDEVYLTDQTLDMKVKVLSQSQEVI